MINATAQFIWTALTWLWDAFTVVFHSVGAFYLLVSILSIVICWRLIVSPILTGGAASVGSDAVGSAGSAGRLARTSARRRGK